MKWIFGPEKELELATRDEFEGFRYAYHIDMAQDYTPTKVVRLVGKYKEVLEFGCGPGHMSKVLTEELGCRVTGIELDEEAAENAQKYCQEVYNIDLDQIDILGIMGNRKFDVLLFADILEHLKSPETLLSTSAKLLAKGGHVVASVPNVGYCGLVAELLVGRFQYRDLGLLDKTHIRFFTRQGLVSMFEQCGLVITDLDGYEVPLELSEFKGAFKGLPRAVTDFITSQKDSMVYQFILKASIQQRYNLLSRIKQCIIRDKE